MKRKIIFFSIMFILILGTLCTSYGSDTKIKSISINKGRTIDLNVDDFYSLDVKVTPENADTSGMKFTSSSPNIADVDYRGNITAKRDGYTTITAKLGGKKATVRVRVSKKEDSLGITFSIKDVSGTDFKEITVTPCKYDKHGDPEEASADYSYYIYLPSGYFVEGNTASYVADKNGVYPFTVFYKSYRRTFFYTVDDIESDEDDEDDEDEDDEDAVHRDDINLNYKLMYDYEKQSVLLNLQLDKIRTVVTPDNKKTVSNVVNYYTKKLTDNVPVDFSLFIDDVEYKYKVIKQGEYYLLIYLEPVDYNDYSSIVEYKGYNFTTNYVYTAVPSKDIFEDNGTRQVLIKSGSASQEVFNFEITNIDYRRPSAEIGLLDDYTFDMDIKDDYSLDYMIAFDGKYVTLGNSKSSEDGSVEINYKHPTKIEYDGNYLFTIVDKAGNRTIATYKVKNMKTPKNGDIDYKVHNYRNTKDLFENTGLLYEDTDSDSDSSDNTFYNILPAYMSGSSTGYFYPNRPVSRAELITVFCKITDLPYDTTAYLKNKFTDIDNHWAKYYIAMGTKKRYMSGYRDKTFKPDNNVTRAEFCEMLTKVKNFKSYLNKLPASNSTEYSDINELKTKKDIIKITGRNLVTGTGNMFYPDKPITRGEVVHALNTLYGLEPTTSELEYMKDIYNKYYNFNDIANYKYYNDIIISIVGMYRENIEEE